MLVRWLIPVAGLQALFQPVVATRARRPGSSPSTILAGHRRLVPGSRASTDHELVLSVSASRSGSRYRDHVLVADRQTRHAGVEVPHLRRSFQTAHVTRPADPACLTSSRRRARGALGLCVESSGIVPQEPALDTGGGAALCPRAGRRRSSLTGERGGHREAGHVSDRRKAGAPAGNHLRARHRQHRRCGPPAPRRSSR